MDKKEKKQLEVLRQRQQKLQMQLAGVRKQADDPSEIRQFEEALKKIDVEIQRLKTR